MVDDVVGIEGVTKGTTAQTTNRSGINRTISRRDHRLTSSSSSSNKSHVPGELCERCSQPGYITAHFMVPIPDSSSSPQKTTQTFLHSAGTTLPTPMLPNPASSNHYPFTPIESASTSTSDRANVAYSSMGSGIYLQSVPCVGISVYGENHGGRRVEAQGCMPIQSPRRFMTSPASKYTPVIAATTLVPALTPAPLTALPMNAPPAVMPVCVPLVAPPIYGPLVAPRSSVISQIYVTPSGTHVHGLPVALASFTNSNHADVKRWSGSNGEQPKGSTELSA